LSRNSVCPLSLPFPLVTLTDTRKGPKKLCIDGTYGVNSTHFAVSEVDVFSNHYYPLNNSILTTDIAAVQSANRVYLAGEIAWTGTKGDSLQSFYDIILKQQNSSSPVVAGSQIWSLFGHNVPDCSVSSPSPKPRVGGVR
jgi:mannan endo-1,4-beta-mannosidase